MSHTLDLYSALPGLRQAVARHGGAPTLELIEAVLAEAVAPTGALTAGEAAFAVSAGFPANDLEPDATAAAETVVGAAIAAATARTMATGLTTSQVAAELGTGTANVRRLLSKGDLYSVGRARTGESIFPSWQFRDGRPVRGLRDVLAAFPLEYHPLDIEHVMTTSADELSGVAPVDWLDTGGPVAPVVELIGSLSLE